MQFTFHGKNVYYESHGQGEPLLMLNGIFMSAASWAAFIPCFSRRHRLLLLDFLDQGKSDKMDGEYTLGLQAELVIAFLDHLNLESVNMCGISYGGEAAMRVASRRPERVRRLILSNTVAYTFPWLRDVGHSWEYAFNSGDGRQFFKTCIPTVYSPRFYEANRAWLNEREALFIRLFDQPVYDAFSRLTASAETHDERDHLQHITAPTLVISSQNDMITPPCFQRELACAIKGAGHVTVSDAGHAVMYEKPTEFTALVLGFIETDTAIPVIT